MGKWRNFFHNDKSRKDLIRMILTMNNFSFNDNHYLQIHGTAMGTKMAPSFANLFLGTFEANALKNAPFNPHTWFRYIDDIFMIWTEGLGNLKIFIDYLNHIHPSIKFTSSHSSTNVSFLDVNVSLTNDGNTRGGGGGVLPYKRLMGMCRWMGSHFHDWSDYNGVAFSIELLEWGRKFSAVWGK